jgi:Tol biopolymer transport system component
VSAAPPKVVTPPDVDAMQPALSPDGRNLAIIGRRLGARPFELMVISTDDPARVTTLRSTPVENIYAPRWSPDGTAVAYSYRQVSSDTPPTFSSCIRAIDVQSLRESNVTSTWESRRGPVENSWGWAADGQSLLASGDRYLNGKVALVRLPMSGAPTAERARTLVSSATDRFFQASESPDGRWITYGTGPLRGINASALYLIRSDGGEPRRLIDGDSWDDKPRWSADGRVIYFLSKRSGSFNVWGIEFDSRRGQTVGLPFQITDFNTPHVQIAGVDRIGDSEIGVAGRRLAIPLQTLSGGIWMLECGHLAASTTMVGISDTRCRVPLRNERPVSSLTFPRLARYHRRSRH